jgi:hypothetical protein
MTSDKGQMTSMMFLFLLLILAGTAAGVWFGGLWSGVVTLVNLMLAMIIATSFFEPAARAIEGIGAAASYTYLLDFVLLWVLFAVAFGVLRAITDSLSRKQVGFDVPVEMAGRSVLAVWCGWLMMCFVAFSLHMAPLNSATPLGAWATPASRTFGPVSPDRLWLGFMYSRSPKALAGNAFDQNADFLLRYRDRRVKYAADGAGLRFQR